MGGFDAVSQEGRLLLGGLGGNAALVQSVIQMLGPSANGVGLLSVVQAFEREGLGPLVASWVGATQNMPVSPAQVQQGLGTARVRQLAQSAGLTEGAAATALSALLPVVVDELTPDGAVPHAGQWGPLVASLTAAVGG